MKRDHRKGIADGLVDFTYMKEGHEFPSRFFGGIVVRHGQAGIFLHLSDITDHHKVIRYIDKYVIPEFKKLEVKS